jgi:hypothetical protein
MKNLYLFLLLGCLIGLSGICARSQSPPPPRVEPVTESSLSNNVFRNHFFGFSMELPPNWQRSDTEDIETAKNISAESLKSKNAKANAQVDEAYLSVRPLLLYTKEPLGSGDNAAIGIDAYRQLSKFVTAKMVAEGTKSTYLKNPSTKLIEDLRSVVINGRQFQTLAFEIEIMRQRIPVRFYLTMVKGYSLAFSVSSPDKALLEKADAAIQTVRFDGGRE